VGGVRRIAHAQQYPDVSLSRHLPTTKSSLCPSQLLEMLVKNSVPQFYQHLSISELFAEMLRVGDPMRKVGRITGFGKGAVIVQGGPLW